MTRLVYLNPEGLSHNPAFSQGVVVPHGADLVFVGGQNGVDDSGQVAADDVGAQTTAALRNVECVVQAAGATLADVVTWTICVVDGQDVRPALTAFGSVWPRDAKPPAISVAYVSALANPAFLVEITAVAAVDAAA